MIKNILIVALIIVGLSSCFKEDDPIPPNPKSPIEQEVIPLTQNYINQVYFRLADGEQVSLNLKSEFDLNFSSCDTCYLIGLNTANFMSAALTQETELEKFSDTTGLEWKFDKSDGNPDSTALIDWMQIEGTDTTYINKVYVINRGIDDRGFSLGLKKIIFKSLKENKYQIVFANLDNSDMKEITIEKNSGFNDIQFSFDENGYIDQIQPEAEDWDLLFTQYTTLLFTDEGESYPYLVTGVLTNQIGTMVAFDSTLIFNNIELEDIVDLTFSADQDKIGYEWKELIGDINGGDFYYQPRPNWNYLIRSQKGLFYKLHFTGFYNPDTGEKGYPAFEFQRL